MRPRSRRGTRYTPDLTSLLDVLFIIVFLALIRAAATSQQLAAQAAPAPPPPSEPVAPPVITPDVAALRARALANVKADLDGRSALVVRVAADGTLEAIEVDGARRALDVPLLEHSPDPDAALAYLGDRSAELRACRIVAVHLGLPDLTKHLVIIAPTVALAELPRALHRGLHDDLLRCLADQHGLATIVDPATLVPSPAPVPASPPVVLPPTP